MAAGQKRQSGLENRQALGQLSQGFIRDFALVWAEEGLEAVRKVAKKGLDPSLGKGIALQIVGNNGNAARCFPSCAN